MTTVTNLVPWGFHGIFDCSNCSASAIKNESTIRSWLTEIAPVVSDGAVSEPFTAVTGEGKIDREGFSAIQLLDTGSITANFINDTKHIYVDVFSCKEFSSQEVEESIKKYFGADTLINKIFLPRKADASAPN